MAANTIPPADPPAASTTNSTATYNSPDSSSFAPTKSTTPQPAKPTTPTPLQGVAPSASTAPSQMNDQNKTAPLQGVSAMTPTSIVEPPSVNNKTAQGQSEVNQQTQPMATSPKPSGVITTKSESNSPKFKLFISILTGVVVLIWIGVGLIYYSNSLLEEELSTPQATTQS